MINFKRIIFFFILINLVTFSWWLILVFNKFPKKFYLFEPIFEKDKTAIIVLTGGKGRIQKGIDLFKNNYGSYLFISGVFKESELGIKDEINKQLTDKDCCVVFGNNATNTIENAYEVKKWLINFSKIENIIVVSSYYHLPRSYIIFNSIMEKQKIKLLTANYEIGLNKNFIFHLKLLILEYFKVLYTVFSIR